MFLLIAFALAIMPHPAAVLLALLSSLLIGMSYTDSIGILYKSAEGTIANTTEPFTGDGHEGVDTNVPALTTDQVEACPITVAGIVACCLFSSLTDLTVKTYLAGVLKDTITLHAGKQIVWGNTFTAACPFTNNFDTFKVTNADASKATNFKARFLMAT